MERVYRGRLHRDVQFTIHSRRDNLVRVRGTNLYCSRWTRANRKQAIKIVPSIRWPGRIPTKITWANETFRDIAAGIIENPAGRLSRMLIARPHLGYYVSIMPITIDRDEILAHNVSTLILCDKRFTLPQLGPCIPNTNPRFNPFVKYFLDAPVWDSQRIFPLSLFLPDTGLGYSFVCKDLLCVLIKTLHTRLLCRKYY